MTVRGLIDADEMGVTSPPEHTHQHQGPLVDMVDAHLASDELLRFAAYGEKPSST
jgi:predicted metal-dependent phosphotriesterase family hydrolase